MRFLDTMSVHIACRGMANHQISMFKSDLSQVDEIEVSYTICNTISCHIGAHL